MPAYTSIAAAIAVVMLATDAAYAPCHLPIPGRRRRRLEQKGVLKEFMLPMRDGVKLSTVAVTPLFSKKTQWPTVVDRSPYGPSQFRGTPDCNESALESAALHSYGLDAHCR